MKTLFVSSPGRRIDEVGSAARTSVAETKPSGTDSNPSQGNSFDSGGQRRGREGQNRLREDALVSATFVAQGSGRRRRE
jgi:hypothetical protein